MPKAGNRKKAETQILAKPVSGNRNHWHLGNFLV
jgi:hypothetical protein